MLLCVAVSRWPALPVVAARVGGVEEIVQQGRTGWLFEPEDWAAAAQILNRVLEHPSERSQIGAGAREHALDQFSAYKMVRAYERLYATLVQTH